jgi:hypothetical protein
MILSNVIFCNFFEPNFAVGLGKNRNGRVNTIADEQVIRDDKDKRGLATRDER